MNDDAHFFDCVKLFMADRDIYNEFLKRVSQTSQPIHPGFRQHASVGEGKPEFPGGMRRRRWNIIGMSR
jgi:hypothetical protein